MKRSTLILLTALTISHPDLLMCLQPEHTFLVREIGCPENFL